MKLSSNEFFESCKNITFFLKQIKLSQFILEVAMMTSESIQLYRESEEMYTL